MNLAELQKEVHRQFWDAPIGLTQNIVHCVFEVIRKRIERNEVVKVQGFGTFRRIRCRARKGRNPRTGKPMIISARWKYKWVPCEELRGRTR